jgi:AbrB family looped-hinge helix DNA binding protein
MTATITSKGQITIPAQVRKRLNLRTGDRVDFMFEPDGRVVLQSRSTPFEQLRGMFHRKGQKAMTVRDMDRARDAALRERWKRISRTSS